MNGVLLLQIIIVLWAISGVSNIIAGSLGVERPNSYGFGSVIYGLVIIGLVIWVLIT